MTIKKIALGACLLATGNALAQDNTYTVRQGDTLSEIASKFSADSKAILHANNLKSADKLKLGQKLRIPTSAKVNHQKHASVVSGTTYSIQSGDTDESIAKKLGVTAKELRLANLGTKWTKLQIGQALQIPNQRDWFDAMATHAIKVAAKVQPANQAKFQLASVVHKTPAKPNVVQRTYTVRNGDNDWIIAKRIGIQPSVLKSLNPGIKWSKLQIGTVLKVPGMKTVSGSNTVVDRDPNLPRLRSRFAVVTGQGVLIRKGPSNRFASIAQVDKGTRVMVLDRDGAWYKLRFPKGTEAWVRGDFLAPTKAPQIYAAKKPSIRLASNTHPSKKSKPTLVASRTTRSSTKSSRTSRNHIARKPSNSGHPLATGSAGNLSLMDKASSFLGVRYRYGAASRSATDCSGFTTQVFKSQGVKLPRTAREQSSRGQKVSRGELKAGDLVFFNTRGSRVSHVGIYKGNGKFIHASSGGGKVMESSLDEGYYKRRFAGARRVISAKTPPKKVAKKEEPKSIPVEPSTTPVEPKVSTPPDNGGN